MFLDRIKANAGLASTTARQARNGNWWGIRSQAVKAAGAFAFLAAATLPMAFGQGMQRVGDVNNANGYPAWFQDKSGLTLDFCSPTTQAELDGGWCVLLAPDLPSTPEVFPTNFFDEHFYFLANATGTTANGGKAKLVLALEGAFGGGPPAPNDQIVFARIRVVVTNLPKSGTYTVYHPYGTDTYPNQTAGDRLFVTEDVGIGCLDCILSGRLGPFLLPSATPGGAEMAAVSGPTGRLYIADPNRLGPVTGSFVTGPDGAKQNYFRVVDPDGNDLLAAPAAVGGKITDFTLNGRIFTGVIPGQVHVDKATYSNDNEPSRVDVFASVFPTLQSRVPGAALAAKPIPQLQYYFGACDPGPKAPAGQSVAGGMRPGADGIHVWGQSLASSGNPGSVCVQDKTSSAVYGAPVTDDVTVTKADYDPNSNKVTVAATSSDRNATLTFGNVNVPNGGAAAVIGVGDAPAETIHVQSSGKGDGAAHLTTRSFSGAINASDVLVAQNLLATVSAGSAVSISVPNAAGSTVNIVSNGTLGTADFNAATNNLTYTANAGASATDTFTYNLVSASATSNTATVTVTITAAPQTPPPGVAETITVGSANYRRDQNRWQITGTDTLANNQVLTIVNIGTAAAPKNFTIGTTTVPAGGAWSFDIRNRPDLAPAAGDRIVAVNTNVNPNITSQPVTAAIR